MKNKIIKSLCMLLVAVMVLGLASCSKNKKPSDPNRFVIGDFELLYKGSEIMLDSDGESSIVMTLDFTNNSKNTTDYIWNIFNTATQNGTELLGAIIYLSEDSYETVTDSQLTEVAPGETTEVRLAYTLIDTEHPVEMTFSDLLEKHKETVTVDLTVLGAPSGANASENPVEETDPLLKFWNGNWYGWWLITGADGGYSDWSNKSWDCCANISVGSDYTGSVVIWDEDMPKDDPICEASVSLSSVGTGEHGTLTSEGGYFLRSELAHADWIVDPALMSYDNLICIDGWYEDDNGSFKYAAYLRPWGIIWDDVEANAPNSLPYNYENWYLPLVNAGKAMPDTIGAEGEAAGEANSSESASESVPEANADDDYGKSNPNATGIAALKDMQDLYKICYESRTNGYHVFTYEDARDMLGCDGVVWKKASYTWNETKHTYRWVTEDGVDYFSISFEIEGDDEWYLSCNFSDNVKNNLW